MNFGEAIEALKKGKSVARSGWIDRFIYLNKGSVHVEDIELSDEDAESTINAIEEEGGNPALIDGCNLSLFDNHAAEGIATRLPNINMSTAANSIVTGWLASQTDMLAEDWMVVN